MPNFDESMAEGMRHTYEGWRKEVTCETFSYQVDGLNVRGFVVAPASIGDEQLPVVIYNRGGNADSGELPFQFIVGKLYPVVKAGFVIVGTQYRGASRDWKPHPDRLRDEFGGDDVNDVLALLPIINDIPFADASRLGMWGMSRGGMMAFLAARRAPPATFDALVAESTPSDLVAEYEFRPAMAEVFRTWIPGFESHPEQSLQDRSILYWLDELPHGLPMLILHGTADTRVSPNSPLELARRLQALGRPYRLVMYEGGFHGLHRGYDAEVHEEVIKWFSEKLHDGPVHSSDSGHRRPRTDKAIDNT